MSKQLTERHIETVINAIRRECHKRYIDVGGKFSPRGRPLLVEGESAIAQSLGIAIAAFDQLPPHPRAEWLKLIFIGYGMGHSGMSMARVLGAKNANVSRRVTDSEKRRIWDLYCCAKADGNGRGCAYGIAEEVRRSVTIVRRVINDRKKTETR